MKIKCWRKEKRLYVWCAKIANNKNGGLLKSSSVYFFIGINSIENSCHSTLSIGYSPCRKKQTNFCVFFWVSLEISKCSCRFEAWGFSFPLKHTPKEPPWIQYQNERFFYLQSLFRFHVVSINFFFRSKYLNKAFNGIFVYSLPLVLLSTTFHKADEFPFQFAFQFDDVCICIHYSLPVRRFTLAFSLCISLDFTIWISPVDVPNQQNIFAIYIFLWIFFSLVGTQTKWNCLPSIHFVWAVFGGESDECYLKIITHFDTTIRMLSFF